MYLDADMENSNVGAALNKVSLTDGRVITAKTLLTLEATTGSIVPAGTLTLQAGAGIVVLNDLVATGIVKPITLKADYESQGDGSLTVVAGKTLNTNDGLLTVTAWDIDLSGAVTSGTRTINIHGAKNAQTIGLGDTAKDMHITDAELSRMTSAGGLRVGGSAGGNIIVNHITQASSNHITSFVTLMAAGDDAQVSFTGKASTFNTLVSQADNGILVQVDVTTDIGILTLDGDSDNASDGHDKVAISGARTLYSAGQMTLDSTTGGIVRSGAAAMTLKSKAGVLINDNFAGTDGGQQLHINADSASSDSGTFTMKSGKALSSTNGVLAVTAADVNIQGTMTSGTATMVIQTATQRTIGLGLTSQQMDIEGSELQRLTAPGLTIGKFGMNKSMKIQGITKDHSNGITGTVTLLATVDDAQIIFQTQKSTFFALATQADNGVLIKVDTMATSGSMYLDGDHENSSTADGINSVEISNTRTVTAKTVLTLESKTGRGIVAQGALTLQSGSGIVLLNDVRGANVNKAVVINSDYENAGDGTLTVVVGNTINSNDAQLSITAWDIDLQGSMTSGTKYIAIHGSKTDQTLGLGSTSTSSLNVSDTEFSRISTQGLIFGNGAAGVLTVNGVTGTGSNNVHGIVSLIAGSDDAQVVFAGLSSVFGSLGAQADNGLW
jgi:hypothetical protein